MNNVKPDILLLMTDQHRFDCLGCYGNDIIETPNIDWIAKEGTVFENAYTPSPSCIPARASMLSGMDPWNVGILGMGEGQKPMGTGFKHTLPGELAKAGYHTQGVGKMHFYPQRSLNGFHNTVLDESGRVEDEGFLSDYRKWFLENRTGNFDIIDHGIHWNSWMARPYNAPEHLHPTWWTTDKSIEFLRNRDPEKPFFLWTSFARPHSPYDPPEYYYNLYMKKDIPMPEVGKWAKVHDVPEDAAKHDAWRGVHSNDEIKRTRAGYYGSISFIDHQIGRILMYLKDAGTLDNTIIIFTSDHGDMQGDNNLYRKTYAYEGSAHIPLIIRFPKSITDRSAERIEVPALLQDIMPTILDAVNCEKIDDLDGISLKDLICGEKKDIREYIHGEHNGCYADNQEMHYLTDGKIKYIWFTRSGNEQLFNLEADPYETIDLSTDKKYSEIMSGLRHRLIKILEKRDCNLTADGKLVIQEGKPIIVSPKYDERVKKPAAD